MGTGLLSTVCQIQQVLQRKQHLWKVAPLTGVSTAAGHCHLPCHFAGEKREAYSADFNGSFWQSCIPVLEARRAFSGTVGAGATSPVVPVAGNSSMDSHEGLASPSPSSSRMPVSVTDKILLIQGQTDDLLADEARVNEVSVAEVSKEAVRLPIGAFQHLPAVSPAKEILASALRRARLVRPTKGIVNASKRERNKGAKQIDTLTKELSGPLGNYVRKFPRADRLHAYEQAVLNLTLGEGGYEEALGGVDALRKRVLDVGKSCASLINKVRFSYSTCFQEMVTFFL